MFHRVTSTRYTLAHFPFRSFDFPIRQPHWHMHALISGTPPHPSYILIHLHTQSQFHPTCFNSSSSRPVHRFPIALHTKRRVASKTRPVYPKLAPSILSTPTRLVVLLQGTIDWNTTNEFFRIGWVSGWRVPKVISISFSFRTCLCEDKRFNRTF